MHSMQLRFFLAGYSGLLLPRAFRRLIAGTTIHRKWLAGDMGVFKEERAEGTVACGVCDRRFMQYRKGPARPPAKLRIICKHLLFPFSN